MIRERIYPRPLALRRRWANFAARDALDDDERRPLRKLCTVLHFLLASGVVRPMHYLNSDAYIRAITLTR